MFNIKISIGEYSVDNINWFKEHEGLDAFQCDIIYCDNKIGFFSESYMNGPDDYTFNNDFDEELKKLRETANKFFDKYSKDDKLFTTEDFFIRFLKRLKEAGDMANDRQKIVISTSYPYDYKIEDNKNVLSPTVLEDIESNKLVIPVFPLNINIEVNDMEEDYGIC